MGLPLFLAAGFDSPTGEADVLPFANVVGFTTPRAPRGGSVTVTFSGNNLTTTTYFDVRFRAPGATADDGAFNWQQGPSAPHAVPAGTAVGDWTITGVRAHADTNDHSGPFYTNSGNVFRFRVTLLVLRRFGPARHSQYRPVPETGDRRMQIAYFRVFQNVRLRTHTRNRTRGTRAAN